MKLSARLAGNTLLILSFLLLTHIAHAQQWGELTSAQKGILAPLQSQWETLPAERKARLLEAAERYQTLTPEQQAQVDERVQRWSNLPPEERERMEARLQKWQSLTDEQREQLKQRFRELTPEQKTQRKAIRTRFKAVRSLPHVLPPSQEAELYEGDSFVPELASSNGGSCHRFTDITRSNRALSVQLRIPSDAPGARPVIVFSHGGGPRSECSFGNAEWGESLAAAGYVVIHIAHSINAADREMACTAVGVPDCSEVMAMLYLRPGDVSAVISQIPAMATRFGLSERIDTSRLGVAGHSFGAYTAMTSVGAKVDLGTLRGKSFADSRIVSALALSPQGTGRFGFYDRGGNDHSWANVSLPVLTQTGLGDGDPLTGEARPDRRIPFMKMSAPDKMEAFLNEQRATHNTFNLTSDAPTEFHDWIRATGIAWFDATLQRRDAARAWLASDALVQVSGELQQVSRKALTPPGG